MPTVFSKGTKRLTADSRNNLDSLFSIPTQSMRSSVSSNSSSTSLLSSSSFPPRLSEHPPPPSRGQLPTISLSNRYPAFAPTSVISAGLFDPVGDLDENCGDNCECQLIDDNDVYISEGDRDEFEDFCDRSSCCVNAACINSDEDVPEDWEFEDSESDDDHEGSDEDVNSMTIPAATNTTTSSKSWSKAGESPGEGWAFKRKAKDRPANKKLKSTDDSESCFVHNKRGTAAAELKERAYGKYYSNYL